MEPFTIYTILLTDDKYYIGKTKLDPRVRFQQHLTDKSAVWTQKYKPLEIINTFKSNDNFAEDKRTKEMMMEYGIENVRGGSYCSVELPDWQVKALEHEFESINDQCYKCKKKGHISRDCEKYHKELAKKKQEEHLKLLLEKYNEYLENFNDELMLIEQIDKINNFIKEIIDLNTIVKKLGDNSKPINQNKIYNAIEIYETKLQEYVNPQYFNNQFIKSDMYRSNIKIYNVIFKFADLAAQTYHQHGSNQKFLQERNLSTVKQQYQFLLYENLKKRIESKNLIQEISENFKLFNFNDTHKDDNYDELLEKLNFFKDLCIDKLSEIFNTD
jgi:predicted GIY-YIG superfamily endonuclease